MIFSIKIRHCQLGKSMVLGCSMLEKRPADGDLSSWNRLRAATETRLWCEHSCDWCLPFTHSRSDLFFLLGRKWRENSVSLSEISNDSFLTRVDDYFLPLERISGKRSIARRGGSIDDFTSSYSEPNVSGRATMSMAGPLAPEDIEQHVFHQAFVSSLEYLVDSLLKTSRYGTPWEITTGLPDLGWLSYWTLNAFGMLLSWLSHLITSCYNIFPSYPKNTLALPLWFRLQTPYIVGPPNDS